MKEIFIFPCSLKDCHTVISSPRLLYIPVKNDNSEEITELSKPNKVDVNIR